MKLSKGFPSLLLVFAVVFIAKGQIVQSGKNVDQSVKDCSINFGWFSLKIHDMAGLSKDLVKGVNDPYKGKQLFIDKYLFTSHCTLKITQCTKDEKMEGSKPQCNATVEIPLDSFNTTFKRKTLNPNSTITKGKYPSFNLTHHAIDDQTYNTRIIIKRGNGTKKKHSKLTARKDDKGWRNLRIETHNCEFKTIPHAIEKMIFSPQIFGNASLLLGLFLLLLGYKFPDCSRILVSFILLLVQSTLICSKFLNQNYLEPLNISCSVFMMILGIINFISIFTDGLEWYQNNIVISLIATEYIYVLFLTRLRLECPEVTFELFWMMIFICCSFFSRNEKNKKTVHFIVANVILGSFLIFRPIIASNDDFHFEFTLPKLLRDGLLFNLPSLYHHFVMGSLFLAFIALIYNLHMHLKNSPREEDPITYASVTEE